MKLMQEEAVRVAERQEVIEQKWEALLGTYVHKEAHKIGTESSSFDADGDGDIHPVAPSSLSLLYPLLQRELEAQRQGCHEMLCHKEALLHEYQAQLTEKDEVYVQTLTRYGQEIDALLNKMRADSKTLQDHYRKEMDRLEETFVSERAEMMETHKATMTALWAKKKATELLNLQTAQQQEEKYQRELESLRVQDGEDYHRLKIQLEMELHATDGALEGVNATSQVVVVECVIRLPPP
jgi:hypothetical protein